jgi:hypothetical protein
MLFIGGNTLVGTESMASRLGSKIALALGLSAVLFSSAVATAESSWDSFNCTALNQKVAQSSVANNSSYDVVIYGGSPAGVAAARSAAKLGKSVLLLSESGLFGGSISNGVSATDLGSLEANVGLAKTYLEDLKRFYHTTDYRTEPKVAECIFLNWLNSDKVTLGTYTNLESATVSSGKISDVTFHTSQAPDQEVTVQAKAFVDASYAGDLMFVSGVKTRLGMADYYSYGETLTKSRSYNLQFKLTDPAEIAQAEIDFAKLPHVSIRENLRNYRADVKTGMPSFTYRLCVTDDVQNRLAFAKTSDYETYAPAWRTYMKNYVGFKIQKEVRTLSNGTKLTQLWRLAKLPNDKYDLNAYYSSFTNLTMSREYFTNLGSRQAILDEYSSYLQSFLYFVQNDPSVPVMERETLKNFGLCADEFTSTNGWPQQPYLREGRRLVGKTTITARDILINRIKNDSVAAGSYALDSKPTLFVFANGTYARDRGVMYRAPIYEIPFSSMIPKQGPKNLVVAVGISASPAAYASIRMEPQYIELGQAAGIAAGLVAKQDGSMSSSLVPAIRRELSAAKGFRGIDDICGQLNPSLRNYWGFKSNTCKPRPFGLIISK